MLPFGPGTGITNSGTPVRLGAKWKRNFANPGSELPAQAPVPTHRYKPREVRRQGYPRESRSPSRRVVVKLGSWSACADGAPRRRGAPSSYSTTPPHATHGPNRLTGRTVGAAPSENRAVPKALLGATPSRHWPITDIPVDPPRLFGRVTTGTAKTTHNPVEGHFSGETEEYTSRRFDKS